MDAILRQGSKGNAVIELQQILQIKGFYTGKIDGDFGIGTANAVLKFQKANSLTADGVVGNASWAKLRSSNPLPSTPQPLPPEQGLPTLLPGSQGQAIIKAQQLLKAKGYYQGRVDGDFGVATRDAIANFQRANGLTVDGKVGAQTWRKLQAPAIAVANPQTPTTASTEVTPTTPSPTPAPTTPSSIFVPTPDPVPTVSPEVTPITPSAPVNQVTPSGSIPIGAISLVDAANSYSRARLPNQTVAINNLQANVSTEILQQFLQRWQVASNQINLAPSLQDALSGYNSGQILNQNLALQWLQSQLLPQALDRFRQDWANLTVAVGNPTDTPFPPSQPITAPANAQQLINLTDAVKAYSRSNSQVAALENLQAAVADQTLQQFFQRWSTASEQSAIAISLLDVFQNYDSQKFPSQVTALQWLEKELTIAQLEKFSRDWKA